MIRRMIKRSLLRAVLECLVGFGALARLSRERIILAAVARPGVERVDHVLEFRRQFRHGAQQHALQRRHLLAMAVGRAFLDLHRTGTVVLDPVQAQRGIELRAETRSEEPVAEETPRGVQSEHHELRLGDRKAVRRVDSASQPTTVSTSSTLSTMLPLGWPRQSSMGFRLAPSWASVITLEASQVCCP